MKTPLLILAALVAANALAADPATTTPTPSAAAAPAAATVAVPLVGQDELLARQAKHDPQLFVLDVRTPEEYAQGHVPGAVNIPHDQVAARLADIPKDKDVVLYCRSGHRAGIAAGVLSAQGYTHLLHLDGDMNGWTANSRPIQAKAPPEAMKN
jgi:rhodanese-related sulfurtransferase